MQRTIESNPCPKPVISAELTRQALCVNPKQGPLSNPLRWCASNELEEVQPENFPVARPLEYLACW